jgi:hypothetical protein
MTNALRRSALVSALVVASVLIAGCSVSDGVFVSKTQPPPTVQVTPSSRGSRLPRLLSSPLAQPRQASPLTGLTPAGRRFVDGVNTFCRSFYEEQKAVDDRFPTIAQRPRYDAAQEASVRRVDAQLGRLHPPPELASAYSQFVANERAVYRARADAAAVSRSGGDSSTVGGEFDVAMSRRHELADQLGARQCDGVLPPAQWRAAARAVQRFVLTADPHQGCVTLVTPQYIPTRWPSASDPMAACLTAFSITKHETPLLRNIYVSALSGVEHLSATVDFTEVPECGCGQLVARLYFENGRWLVRAAYKQD